ncbi:MAG TPA: hypothetical protein VGI78_02265 [Acetobacteraceae bacterium]|jgi:hypothetical protein
MTDYTVMSGAEFQREVGTDTRKWAEAMYQALAAFPGDNASEEERTDFLERWLSDAMDAARKAKPPAINPDEADPQTQE